MQPMRNFYRDGILFGCFFLARVFLEQVNCSYFSVTKALQNLTWWETTCTSYLELFNGVSAPADHQAHLTGRNQHLLHRAATLPIAVETRPVPTAFHNLSQHSLSLPETNHTHTHAIDSSHSGGVGRGRHHQWKLVSAREQEVTHSMLSGVPVKEHGLSISPPLSARHTRAHAHIRLQGN